MTRCVPLVMAIGLFAAGCSDPKVPTGRTADADPSRDGIPDLVRANNTLAVDLYGQLRAREGNLFFSPTSVASALAMSCTGASGSTFQEIRKVLRDPGGPIPLHITWAAFLRDLADGNLEPSQKRFPVPVSEIRVANALWYQSGYPIVDEVRSTLKDGYGATVTPVDFLEAPNDAAKLINEWVTERTSGKITQVVGSGDLNPNTKLVVTNAVYFRGNWDEWFSKDETKPGDFHVTSHRKVPVPMMTRTLTRSRYSDGGAFQALEMSYSDRRFAMVVLLPKEVDGLRTLEPWLTSDRLASVLSRLAPKDEVIVTLPKFSIRDDLELDKVLSNLGMPGAFGPSADFSALTGSKNGLFLARVAHVAAITVDEEGTEAAAWSGVFSSDGYGDEPPKPLAFRADHPFLFLIHDRRTGAILFLGRLAIPE